MKKKYNRAGYTLVEAVVAIALFSIGAMMLASALAASGGLIRSSTKTKSYGQRAAAVIEGATVAGTTSETESGSFSFTAGGSTITIDGDYSTVYDDKDPGIKFHIFEIPENPPA